MNDTTHKIGSPFSEEQRFNLLVNSIRDYAIFMLTPEGEVASWNPGAERFKGYKAEEIIGSHFSRFYTPEDQEKGLSKQALQTARESGIFEDEGWRVRKDGSRLWAHVVIDPIVSPDGELLGYAKITRDLTERQAAEAALAQAKASLMHAQKMEAIGQLTGGIAHDFNNLLTVIVNSLDMLARTAITPNETRLLKGAQDAADRGAKLTRQLLAFARRQPLRQEAHNLNSLIERFEAILRRAGNDTTSFDFQLAEGLPLVLVDAPQFEAAMLNLVVNARDAMQDGGCITLATTSVMLSEQDRVDNLPPGPYACVTVSDTGHGMAADVMERAAEPFFTTKDVGKGSGLGLSQVYGFAVQSNGAMTIESRIGMGTSISLYFPAVAGDTLTHGSAEQDESAGKVLIVEDEQDVLDLSAEFFRSMGFEVLTASNGLDAIDVLKRTRDIDLLFTDVVMPKGMNGVELARFTRKLCPQIDVILASGYPAPMIADKHGAFDDFSFISKPYRWSELRQEMRALRDKRVQ